MILQAEAQKQAAILRGEGERAAQYLTAQGQAKAVETTFSAIHAAQTDPALLAYQYLQTLPKIAQGDANKVWMLPTEFSKALEGLSRLGGGDPNAPSFLQAEGSAPATPGEPIDTSGWFDVHNTPLTPLTPDIDDLPPS
jgi:hypothetical protein